MIINNSLGCKWVWNYYLTKIGKDIRNGNKLSSSFDLSKDLTLIKKNKEYFWLNKINRKPIEQTIEILVNSYQRYITSYVLNKPNKVGEPKYKSRKKDAITMVYNKPDRLKFNNTHTKIRIPSIGYVRFRGYRGDFINSRIMSLTIKVYPNGDVEASYNVECENQTPTMYKEIKSIGLDMGVKKFVTDSEGGKVLPLDIKRDINKLINLQRKMTNCSLKQSNYYKLLNRVNKQYKHISNKRDYFIHHVANLYSKYKYINIEDLDVIKMVKNTSGTVDNPNMDAKRKSLLNKSILENAWSKFFTILEYKVNMREGVIRRIEPANTSTTCSCCGVIDRSNRVKEVYACKSCGSIMDADHNAAINILNKGIKVI